MISTHPNTPQTNAFIRQMSCNEAKAILRKRYIDHEIDATLYASLMEDVARIESRIKR